ncbi:MAG: hypothetical protein LBB55_06760, partial [Zoogloeaceae bacterium]|nr:hypothetical protein [Zoogloeaceae bacterium]
KPVPQIVGIVRWNERQLLADQAVLVGEKNVPSSMAMPLTPSELSHFASEYRKPAVVKSVGERVPLDLLWLFRRTWPSGIDIDDRPGADQRSMDRAMEKGSKGYTKLVFALIDRCFVPDGVNLRYTSILDAADLIPLEQYKIDMSTR